MSTEELIDHGIVDCLDDKFIKYQLEIFNIVSKQIQLKFNNQNNLILNTTWMLNFNFDKIKNKKYDNVFLVSCVDAPYEYSKIIQTIKSNNFYQIGNIDETIDTTNFFLQLSCLYVDMCFNFVSDDQLKLNTDNLKTYLCYQNKPHDHRLYLTKQLKEQNLLDSGIVTLAGFLDISENKNISFLGKHNVRREDPCSFGDLTVWNRCFLNVVAETHYNNTSRVFTEKTYKPIIGLRPFIILGSYKILKYLKDKGFYTFEEYWNESFTDEITVSECINKICSVINFLKNKSNEEIELMYNDMLPKLLFNKNLFFENLKNEKKILNNIFENYK